MAPEKSSMLPPLRTRGIEWRRVNWSVVTGIAVMHVGAVVAPFYFTWTALVLALVLMWLSGNIGITMCYHRLLTHRSFKTPKWFEYVLALCGCLAWQGGPVQWVGIHRIHHKHSDEDTDPHTPRHGFTWSHALWCMHHDAEGQKGVDAAKDLLRDPGMRWINRLFWVPNLLMVPALYFAGEWVGSMGVSATGLSWVLWGVALRITIVYHGTWFVNSATHTWGYRNYDTTDNSTNLWWVALLSFGEGWHNNHHAHQRSAAHGLRWYEIDITYWQIRALGLIGLARDIVLPKPEDRPQS